MKAYTYNDRLVGVGNDQILGTDQGGGSTYTAGNGIDITNDVISVDDTVALVSALPTTELGKFTIQSNVSGGPIEVICPTDQGHPIETVILDNNAVSGTSGSGTSSVYIVYKSPGYDDDYYSAEGSAILHIPEAVTGLAQIQIVYAPNSNPYSYQGPSFTTPQYIYGDSTGGRYVLDAGDYDVNVIANQVPQGGGYGKYITLYAAGPAPDVQSLLKSSFSLAVRHPEMGITVNLDRYTLGNTSTITNTSGYTQATVYNDPVTKKQSVYLPSSMPYNWNSGIIQSFEYGSNYNSPSSSSYDTKQYRAYKYTSSPRRYQFAYCTDWDSANKLMTFIAYDNSGNAIEKWTLNYTTYGSNVWTTTPITPDMSEYISYSASGVYLPNSKFEIDTNGQAFKLISESTETNYGSWNGDGSFSYGNYYTLPTRNADGTGTLKAGTYRFTLPETVNSIKVGIAGNTAAAYNGMVIPATNHVADLVITEDLTFIPYSQGYDWIYINGWTNSDGTGSFVWLDNANSSAVYIAPAVTEEYLTDGDLELNGNDQVTAIDGHALAAGSTYTAGDHIGIVNDEISVTGVTDLVAGENITITVSGVSAIIAGQAGGSTYTAGTGIDITSDVISVDSTVAMKTDIPAPISGASGIVIEDSVVSLDNPLGLVAGDNITIEVSGVSAIISAQGGGATYTAGTGIDINNDIISIDNTVAMASAIPSVPSAGNMLSISNNTLNVTTTAGITDIVSVTALPANPVATVIYLIPET